jgi:hypothetical protein
MLAELFLKKKLKKKQNKCWKSRIIALKFVVLSSFNLNLNFSL